jgi:hypothetical protein
MAGYYVPKNIIEYKRNDAGSQIPERPKVHSPDEFSHSERQKKAVYPHGPRTVFFDDSEMLVAHEKRDYEISEHQEVERHQEIEVKAVGTGVSEKNSGARGGRIHSSGRLVSFVIAQAAGTKK